LDVYKIDILRTNSYQIGKANVLIRTASDLKKRYLFGLNYISAEEIYNLENSYIAFVCGSKDNVVFIPSDVLVKHLPRISHDRNGEYKINFTRDFNLVLRGRGKKLDCSPYINNWDLLSQVKTTESRSSSPEESIHSLIQGRLIEIGNIRGFKTYCPDKSKQFNKKPLYEITSLQECPKLQFTDHLSLRKIDVIWFREINMGFYPEYAFEVEITTGVWSGFGRLATLKEYNTKMYIITNEEKRFTQVANSFPELRPKFTSIIPDKIGLLYSAEINLIKLRKSFNLKIFL